MTKPVAAVAVMTLVEEGRLRLTHPVERFLPAFRSLRVLDDAGTAQKPQRSVTVQDLLTHTSGMGNELSPGQVGEHYRRARLHADPTRTLAELVDEVATLPLGFDPGSRWL